HRSEARADAALNRARELETHFAASTTQGSAQQESLQGIVLHLEAENKSINKRLETEQALNATLRDRIDALHVDLRQSTEHYAQQTKEATPEAEGGATRWRVN